MFIQWNIVVAICGKIDLIERELDGRYAAKVN